MSALRALVLEVACADWSKDFLPSVPPKEFLRLVDERLPVIVQELIDHPYPEIVEQILNEQPLPASTRPVVSHIVRNYLPEALVKAERFATRHRVRDWRGSQTAKWLAERGRAHREWTAAYEAPMKVERARIADRRSERATQGRARHAQRMANEQLKARDDIASAKTLAECATRTGLKKIVQGVKVSVLAHLREDAIRRFAVALADLGDRELQTLRRKVPRMRKSPVAILSEAITRELARRRE